MCQLCERFSAVFWACERDDRGPRNLLLCRDCVCLRTLTWERFRIRVTLDYVEGAGR